MFALEGGLSYQSTLSLSRLVKAGFDGLESQVSLFKAEQQQVRSQEMVTAGVTGQCIDMGQLTGVIQDAVNSAHVDNPEYLLMPDHTTGADPSYDTANVQELASQADAILLGAIESGIWSLESADIFYRAIEQLPEELRFEYYVKQSAALNSGDIHLPQDADPSLLLR